MEAEAVAISVSAAIATSVQRGGSGSRAIANGASSLPTDDRYINNQTEGAISGPPRLAHTVDAVEYTLITMLSLVGTIRA